MRILHILEPTSAGVPRLVSLFAEQQIATGNTVHVLAPNGFEQPLGCTISRWSIDRKRPLTFLAAAREVNRVVQDFEPDVVHAHSFFAGLIARLPMVSVGSASLIYQPHAWAFDVLGGHARWLIQAWERHAAARTDALVANCADELGRGRAAGIKVPGWAVGIAVNVAYLRPPTPAERTASRKRLELDPGSVILVLGRIAAQKGQDQLVSAWVREPVTGARLALVGAGATESLQRLAGAAWGQDIIHAGETPDVRDWLWAADLLVIPSRYETVSLVAGEGMAAGLPVIATRFDGVSELLGVDGADPAGVVVPLADMGRLLDTVRQLLANPAHAQQLGRSGRERAGKYCSPRKVEEVVRSVYENSIRLLEVP